jgi:adenylosuccinate lyase
MIARYSFPEMASIWSEDGKQQIWLDVELCALQAMEQVGLAPAGSAESVKQTSRINPCRANQIEREVKHDVIAFLSSVMETADERARFLHRGMTSNDLLDTAFAIQLKRAGELILRKLDVFIDTLRARAEEFKYTQCIGRSHGMHAEPITFGLRLASFYTEMKRRRSAVSSALALVSCGKLAGPVGTYAYLPPAIERHVMESFGLSTEEVPSQVVHRDRHAQFFSSLALLGSSVERICVEIRHLQRSEVGEAAESFSSGQKGSSAMPHKKNPVASENLTGVARLLRGYAHSALENVALWHDRDLSHSSVERVIGPDACILADYMLSRINDVIADLEVFPEQMQRNLESSNGLIFSGTLLCELVGKGMHRDAAYRLLQQHALQASNDGLSLKERVKSDSELGKLFTTSELDAVFDLKRHLVYVDSIFERALAA